MYTALKGSNIKVDVGLYRKQLAESSV